MKDTKIVYTDDPKLSQKCPKCKEFISQCKCIPEVDPKNVKFVALLRIEKAGRGGKTVTIIERLPSNETYLKELSKTLKNKLGTGGTYKRDGLNGIIELQGDKRQQVKEIFEKMGISCKG